MFTKVSLRIVLVVSVLLSGCNGEPQKMVRLKILPGAQLEQGWQPQYLNDLGFMFGLPDGWEAERDYSNVSSSGGSEKNPGYLTSKQFMGVKKKKVLGGFSAACLGAGSKGNGLFMGVIEGEKYECKDYQSLKDATKDFVDEAREALGWTQFEQAEIELPVGPAMRVRAIKERESATMILNLYVLVDGKSQYIMAFLGISTAAEDKVPTLKIMNSFRVFPPEVQQPKQPGASTPGVTSQPGTR